ncbi:hypothetical protein [Prosthecobacter sp.]|uniref:hypothetical protein n=1 Tax=Prosthecobacter sp. TaxID=1965333 RepID=UPI003783FADF
MKAAFAVLNPNALPLTVCFIFAGLWSAAAQQPLFHLQHGGSFSPYRHYEVVINPSCEATVSISKYRDEKGQAPLTYETKLSEYEMSALLETIVATGLREARFSESKAGVGDGGLTSISVHCEDWSNTVSFTNAPVLGPLSSFAHQLVSQAEIVREVESGGNPYDAMTAVNPEDSGAKVLQPYVLKKPLIAYVKTSTNRQRLGWAFAALARLTTPNEYFGLVAAERRRPERTEILRYIGDGGGAMSREHSAALRLLDMSFIQSNYRTYKTLSYEDKNKLEVLLSRLAKTGSRYAMALLTEVFASCQKDGLPPQMVPLHEFKRDGLAVLHGFLQNGDAFLREAAIKQCTVAAHIHSKSDTPNTVSPFDLESIRDLYQKQVLPALINIKANDPALELRHRTEAAIAEIETELRK